MDDEELEHDGEGDMPMAQPVPDGWLPDPDPDTDDGVRVVHPGCMNILEMRRAVKDQERVMRQLYGEFD